MASYTAVRNLGNGALPLPFPYTGIVPGNGRRVIPEPVPAVTAMFGGVAALGNTVLLDHIDSGKVNADELIAYAEPNGTAFQAHYSRLLSYTDPAAAADDAVHAAYGGDETVNVFPGPITNPDVPRLLVATFEADWDGGAVTIIGTDQFGAAVSESLTAPGGGGAVKTANAYAIVTSISKAAVGVDPATVKIGTGDELGIGVPVVDTVGLVFADYVAEAVTINSEYVWFLATTVPDGSTSYKLIVNVGNPSV